MHATIMFKDGFFTAVKILPTIAEAEAFADGYQYGLGESNSNHSAAYAIPSQLAAAQEWRDKNQDLPLARPMDEYEKAIAACVENGVVVE